MNLTVISGGQTGSDQSALRTAKSLRIPTGGWLPKGWLTEDGPRPEFRQEFGMLEHHSPAYPPRTHANAADADVTVWFGRTGSPGYFCTKKGCTKAGKPFLEYVEPFDVNMAFILANMIRGKHKDSLTVNCAGPRESTQPGIGERAEKFMRVLFEELLK